MGERGHVPVLLESTLAVLAPGPGDVVIDCTAGLGGHAAAFGARVGPGGTVVLLDLDAGNLQKAAAHVRALSSPPSVYAVHASFAGVARHVAELGLRADVVLADLGFASTQVDDPARGLSFQADGPLDMRLDPSASLTAADLVNGLPEAELARIISEFGEERHARVIAQKLARERRGEPITTTARLAAIVRGVVGPRSNLSPIDPATRTFQALRIAVNDELGSLDALLAQVREGARSRDGSWLAPGARVGIISFHSLEDRPVKRAFDELVRGGAGVHLTDGPAAPTPSEIAANPRARSAKFRAVRVHSGRETGRGDPRSG